MREQWAGERNFWCCSHFPRFSFGMLIWGLSVRIQSMHIFEKRKILNHLGTLVATVIMSADNNVFDVEDTDSNRRQGRATAEKCSHSLCDLVPFTSCNFISVKNSCHLSSQLIIVIESWFSSFHYSCSTITYIKIKHRCFCQKKPKNTIQSIPTQAWSKN